ncbi:MAG: chitooligosaccharide deacetylase [Bacilli bacterium]|nr:chitooligosaccharide deacetylase [Bacilli bacterium]
MKRSKLLLILFFCAAILAAGLTHPSAHADSKGRKYYEQRGEVLWEVPTQEKVIALTFDDGPDPVYTPQILDLLRKYHAKATFFAIGSNIEKYPGVARREVFEGHELANHTYSHIIGHLSASQLQQEILRTQQIIFRTTGTKPSLFRPPGGNYSPVFVETAKQNGLTVIMWSWDLDTRDWSRPGVKKIVNKVMSNLHNGDVVLFHDHGYHCDQTVAALKIILPELQNRNYQMITISQLISLRSVK